TFLVKEYVGTFFAQVETEAGSGPPDFVKYEFEALLECGIPALGFSRLRCTSCAHTTSGTVRPGGTVPTPTALACMRCAMNQRKELEHLCCYITRPPVVNERLALNDAGQVVLTPK